MANSFGRTNSIESLDVNGAVFSNPFEIGDHIVQHYNMFYMSSIVAGLGWMVSLLSLLMRKWHLGW